MEEIELLNNEIEDFMRKVPSAIIKYGTGLMFLLALALILGSAIFKYPNIVKAPVTILTKRSVWYIVKRTDHQIVTTDDTIIYREMINFKSWLLTDPDKTLPGTTKDHMLFNEKASDLRNINLWEKKHIKTMLINDTNLFPTSSQGKQMQALLRFGELSATVKLTSSEVGMVKSGQRAVIKLEKYPYNEFGVLEGKINGVSSLMTSPDGKEHYYEATVFFPAGLKTSFHKQLSLDTQLLGVAEIITNNESLLERILKPIYTIRNGATTNYGNSAKK